MWTLCIFFFTYIGKTVRFINISDTFTYKSHCYLPEIYPFGKMFREYSKLKCHVLFATKRNSTLILYGHIIWTSLYFCENKSEISCSTFRNSFLDSHNLSAFQTRTDTFILFLGREPSRRVFISIYKQNYSFLCIIIITAENVFLF